MVNLPTRSVSRGAFDEFSDWSATHALKLLIRNQAKSLKGQGKIEKVECTLPKAKLNNEKIERERDRLKYDLNVWNEESTRLAKDLVTKK
ncbi:hypothetical protein WN944_003079 [Citrus x changshan-huyou]|uniref:Uncharacterized protein n=1 Tax=Citrus x changshan-huyou TaxID=2935761 RepID=A0AAP0QHM8_9ROSI